VATTRPAGIECKAGKRGLTVPSLPTSQHSYLSSRRYSAPNVRTTYVQSFYGNKIPLFSVDRYGKAHRRRHDEANGKLLSEEFQELTHEQIATMVEKMVPALRKKLRTSAAIVKFLDKLYDALDDPLVTSAAKTN
jgi:hypothetical protein